MTVRGGRLCRAEASRGRKDEGWLDKETPLSVTRRGTWRGPWLEGVLEGWRHAPYAGANRVRFQRVWARRPSQLGSRLPR
jgi:hypothetical protein